MKVRCDFCGSMYEDTLNSCPNCGAVNTQVRRSTPDQPTTIEDLKAWYESKGLPPYETTRFFIGIDYNGPRAFGIYKDPNNGNYVVYKNKDNGTRAVRYQGTDEAYAVNELFMRLKQEIVEQKARNVSRQTATAYGNTTAAAGSNSYYTRPRRQGMNIVWKIVIAFFAIQIFIGVMSSVMVFFMSLNRTAEEGYYRYNNEIYYCNGYSDNTNDDWVHYNRSSGDWELIATAPGEELKKNKTAKDYIVSTSYIVGSEYPDFQDSRLAYELRYVDGYTRSGYYEYEGNDYYHLDSYDTGSWYLFGESGDWEPVAYDSLPEDLRFEYDAKDFYYYPTWDSSTQISDFSDTTYYQEYERELEASRSYSYDDDDDDYDSSWDSYDSSDYSWDSGSDSWDSGSTDWGSDW
ncbi:MAG: hypothetical protein K6B44_02635 [Lachnospiraceae bacterium]|nr:hypothetical protein [Lachnospiraceae bacterium]